MASQLDRPRLALVIGISSYAIKKLPNAVKDAKDMAQMLEQKAGFQVTSLLDPSRESLILALGRLSKSIKPDSIVLFYYAGHGMAHGGKNYMMLPDYEHFMVQAGADTTCSAAGFAMEDALSTITNAAERGIVIALLDTCRTDAAAACGQRTRGVAQACPKMNLDIAPRKSTYLLKCFACSHASEAQDGSNGSNGLYTKHLLQHIFDNKYADILEAMEAVVDGVSSETFNGQLPENLFTPFRLTPFKFPFVKQLPEQTPTTINASPPGANTEKEAPSNAVTAWQQGMFVIGSVPQVTPIKEPASPAIGCCYNPVFKNMSLSELVQAMGPAALPTARHLAIQELAQRARDPLIDNTTIRNQPGLVAAVIAWLKDNAACEHAAAALSALADVSADIQALQHQDSQLSTGSSIPTGTVKAAQQQPAPAAAAAAGSSKAAKAPALVFSSTAPASGTSSSTPASGSLFGSVSSAAGGSSLFGGSSAPAFCTWFGASTAAGSCSSLFGSSSTPAAGAASSAGTSTPGVGTRTSSAPAAAAGVGSSVTVSTALVGASTGESVFGSFGALSLGGAKVVSSGASAAALGASTPVPVFGAFGSLGASSAAASGASAAQASAASSSATGSGLASTAVSAAAQGNMGGFGAWLGLSAVGASSVASSSGSELCSSAAGARTTSSGGAFGAAASSAPAASGSGSAFGAGFVVPSPFSASSAASSLLGGGNLFGGLNLGANSGAASKGSAGAGAPAFGTPPKPAAAGSVFGPGSSAGAPAFGTPFKPAAGRVVGFGSSTGAGFGQAFVFGTPATSAGFGAAAGGLFGTATPSSGAAGGGSAAFGSPSPPVQQLHLQVQTAANSATGFGAAFGVPAHPW